MNYNWKCPFCNHDVTIRDTDYEETTHSIREFSNSSSLIFEVKSIICPNAKCRKHTLSAFVCKRTWSKVEKAWVYDPPAAEWRLIPSSRARPFPDYVPKPVRDDYEEACLICDLSPKASSTLARRCLQGMIRDFWQIKKGKLADEIDALEGKVEALTWQAIDAVRSIGNIGAHMEKEINLIIDVDPDEASKLIYLIEILIEDWYIARHEKEKHLLRVVELGEKKKQAKFDAEKTINK